MELMASLAQLSHIESLSADLQQQKEVNQHHSNMTVAVYTLCNLSN